SSSKDALMIARLPGTSSAPPTPCTALAAISCPTPGARPHQTDAMAKMATPVQKIRRRPKRSLIDPPTRISAARNNAYDSTTHCTSTTVALRFSCNAGIATLTTVPSINAMLEPRIVAARIHGASALVQGRTEGPDKMEPSSQGCLNILAIVRTDRLDSA